MLKSMTLFPSFISFSPLLLSLLLSSPLSSPLLTSPLSSPLSPPLLNSLFSSPLLSHLFSSALSPLLFSSPHLPLLPLSSPILTSPSLPSRFATPCRVCRLALSLWGFTALACGAFPPTRIISIGGDLGTGQGHHWQLEAA